MSSAVTKSDKVGVPDALFGTLGAYNSWLDGYAIEHDGLCTTVFSAPNYVDQAGNKGAFVSPYVGSLGLISEICNRSESMNMGHKSTPNLTLSHIHQ